VVNPKLPEATGSPAGNEYRWDLLYPFAPKALLVLRDSFGTYSPAIYLERLEEFEKLRTIYNVAGHDDPEGTLQDRFTARRRSV
jgi:hypothetical protein